MSMQDDVIIFDGAEDGISSLVFLGRGGRFNANVMLEFNFFVETRLGNYAPKSLKAATYHGFRSYGPR